MIISYAKAVADPEGGGGDVRPPLKKKERDKGGGGGGGVFRPSIKHISIHSFAC
jgi:hypothetical protein